ncbi:putative Glycosyl transferase family 1 [Candidatus Zixiibacteriota bacterium]|nr:putative Glycosyl transferase family 1 [candidate division Zixibacteria bacterium]
MPRKLVILGYSASVHVTKWAEGLSRSGYDVTVLSCGGKEIDGIRTIIFGEKSGPFNYFRYLTQVRHEIRKINPAILHAFQVTGYGHWGAFSSAFPKVLTAMGSDIIITARKSLLHKSYVQSIIRRYDRLTASSRYLKEQVESASAKAIERVSVVPFGVEIPEEFKSYSNGTDAIRLVYMKYLLPVYGPDILLKALAIVKKSGLSVQLDMYGTGREEAKLKTMAADLNIAESVMFRGWLEPKMVAGAYRDYDIMVMPSRSESFGVAAVEALASGLPVIGSRIGGIPEIIIDGQTGILVEPENSEALAEAIMTLARDSKLRYRMGQAGRKFVTEKFHWDESLRLMLHIYDRLLVEREMKNGSSVL